MGRIKVLPFYFISNKKNSFLKIKYFWYNYTEFFIFAMQNNAIFKNEIKLYHSIQENLIFKNQNYLYAQHKKIKYLKMKNNYNNIKNST